MNKPTLYLMLGYPGAGKTTTAEHIAKLTGAVLLTSDKIRLELFPKPSFSPEEHAKLYAAIDKRTEKLLKGGSSVIYDANLNRYEHRKEKYDICSKTGATPKLVWLNTSIDLARHRATKLSGHDKKRRPYGNLENSVFDRLAREIEMPTAEEKPTIIDGSQISEAIVRAKLGL